MIAMSLSSLITSASGQGYIESASKNLYENSLDSLYTAVSNSMSFKEERFKKYSKKTSGKIINDAIYQMSKLCGQIDKCSMFIFTIICPKREYSKASH